MSERSRILIVDDEPFNVDYLEQELEDLGFDTESAASGREALEKVADNPPDLILLDVMMPEVDGFTVCRMLKDDRKTRLIPIIIMTSLSATEDRIKGIEAGADDFLTKPVDERELMARIRTALKLKGAIEQEIAEVRKISDHLAKFVPDAVRRIVAANPDAPELRKREQDVSVLFVDISGYSRLSELMAPEVLNLLVERYFSAFLDRIHDADGEVSETSGDGMMAIFEDGIPERHAVKAVDTALALLAANEALNADNSVQPLEIHMGVNSGPALMGSTRFQGRRGVRWVFTADGPVINLAARLANVAKGGQVVAGPETIRRVAGRYDLEAPGPESLKNIADPVEIFRVLGPASVRHKPPPTRATREAPGPGAPPRRATVLAVNTASGDLASAAKGLVDENGGRVIGRDGDTVIAEFGSPLAAVRCALALESASRARIGIAIGDAASEDGNAFGEGVDLALALGALAEPGRICVTDPVHRYTEADVDGVYADGGERTVAGRPDPLRVYLLSPAGPAAQ